MLKIEVSHFVVNGIQVFSPLPPFADVLYTLLQPTLTEPTLPFKKHLDFGLNVLLRCGNTRNKIVQLVTQHCCVASCKLQSDVARITTHVTTCHATKQIVAG